MIMFLFTIPISMIAAAIIDIVSKDFETNVSTTVGVLAAVSIFIIAANLKETPASIDVYRGKTTLEITYKDSVAVDSVVVFK